ncbi:MAG TPA: tRNA adenosine(34) deaminase TadA [Kiritimatiellia bacterium]|nr:tRNA adenosine(34) deaminase TadA [Kiritimatiellia bacterium]
MSDVAQEPSSTADHERYMRLALKEAAIAAAEEEVPVGAVIVHQHRIIGKAHNQVERLKDPTAHAEMIAITQAASALADWRLTDTVLYVTKEPCPMCAGAIVAARVPLVVWGMTDPLRGGSVSLFNTFQNPNLNHRVDHIAGVLEQECKELVQEFFKGRRAT